MPHGTLTSKGQVTIPKEVRDELELQPGDRIEFEVRDGAIVGRVRHVPDVMTLYESLPGIEAHAYDPEGEATAFARAALANERNVDDE